MLVMMMLVIVMSEGFRRAVGTAEVWGLVRCGCVCVAGTTITRYDDDDEDERRSGATDYDVSIHRH